MARKRESANEEDRVVGTLSPLGNAPALPEPVPTERQLASPPDDSGDLTSWLAARREEFKHVVYCLPESMFRAEVALSTLFGLSDLQRYCEREFARMCAAAGAIGQQDNQWVRYRWLTPRLPQPSSDVLRRLNWSDSEVASFQEVVPLVDSIDDRMKASIGRRLANRKFLEERDRLRAQWNRLAEHNRPRFPLNRPHPLPELPQQIERQQLTAAARRFADEFGQFCDRWELLGMATWDLPEPRGPHWPVIGRGDDDSTTMMNTPVHFPLATMDQVGQFVRSHHDERSREASIDDQGHWQTYAHFLDLHHWETVLQVRYRDNSRCRAFKTHLRQLLAGMIGVDAERVKKLRRWLNKLQTGAWKSLSGRR